MIPRRRRLPLPLLVLVLLASARPVRAQFPWAGARAVGMGGAEVAAVDDATAAWSNPAALGRLEGWNIQLFASGLASNRNDLVGSIDRLSRLPFDAIAAGNRPDLLPALLADLDGLLRPDTAVLFSGVAALAVDYKGFSLSVGDVAYGGIYPVIDLTHVVPQGGPENGLSFSSTGLSLAALSAREVRIAYGYGLVGRTVLVGGAARLVFGRTYFDRCGAFDGCRDQDLVDLVDDAFKETAVASTKFAFDLGAQANLGIVKLGIVGVSLNQPDFDVASRAGAPATVPLPRQVRGGVAVNALPFLTLAADGDLLKSDTLAPETRSQQLSLGAEVRIPLFAFRVGGFRDLAATQPHWGYSLGVGFAVPLLSVDASVLLTPKGGFDPRDVDRQELAAGANVRIHF